jgi:hypothetical protein
MENHMASTTTATPRTATAPVEVPLTAWLAAAVAMATLYLVLKENGALLAQSWQILHEFFHDGRHLFGAACH